MPSHPQTLFGRRLRSARQKIGLAQDRLGVMIGLDEGTSSARISRYETGAHEPPFAIAEKLAAALNVPAAYFYCQNDTVAEIVLMLGSMSTDQLEQAKEAIQALAVEK